MYRCDLSTEHQLELTERPFLLLSSLLCQQMDIPAGMQLVCVSKGRKPLLTAAVLQGQFLNGASGSSMEAIRSPKK